MESLFVCSCHHCSTSSLVYVNSPSGHMANHRDIMFGKYMCLCVILMYIKILDQCDLYFRNDNIFYFYTFVNYTRSNVQRKAKFCTLLYLCSLHISPNTFESLTFIQNLAVISVFFFMINVILVHNALLKCLILVCFAPFGAQYLIFSQDIWFLFLDLVCNALV